jgi:hypothetical protein
MSVQEFVSLQAEEFGGRAPKTHGTPATKQASPDVRAFGRTEFVHFDSESCFFPLL